MMNTVNMQRDPSLQNKTASMPQPGAYGGAPQMNNAPYRPPGQQFAPAGGQYAPPPANQFNMAGGPPPSNQFNMAGGPPPYATAPNPSMSMPNPTAPPYATAPSMGSMPPQQQYGTQQPYGNPPLQQPAQMGAPYGGQPYNSGGQYGAGGMGMGMPPAGGYVGSVSLAKGGNMSLTKANPNLTRIRIGLGWDVRQTGGPAFDLDASAFMLKADGKVRMSQDLIFYNNKQSVDGSVFHHGDNITGVGEGDDEIVSIDLTRVPPEIQKIVFTVSIYEAEMRQQNFGMVSRAFIRVLDDLTHQEMCRFDLTEEASLLNTMIFGEVYRYGNEWKFRAVGQGIQGGLKSIGGMFGLNLQ